MSDQINITYCEYGEGENLLFAFHGYGMEGSQFDVLKQSLYSNYRIIGFELPFHPKGPETDINWFNDVKELMRKFISNSASGSYSLAGYSIGARIALSLAGENLNGLKELYLFAPYGMEEHWGLQFVSAGFGNTLFRLLVSTSLPIHIMKLVTLIGIIDDIHYAILKREMGSREKRLNLCNSLKMAGQLSLDRIKIIDRLNKKKVTVVLMYGNSDVIFPYRSRNQSVIRQIDECIAESIDEGHWLVTEKLDQKLNSILQLS